MKFEVLNKIKESKLAEKLGPTASKIVFKAKQHAPEALVGAGVIFMVVGTGVAIKKTLEAEPIFEDAKAEIDAVKTYYNTVDHETVYSAADYRKDLAKAYIRNMGKVAIHYGPAMAFEVLGVAFIGAGHNMIRKENLKYIAAAKALDETFKTYRGRVKNYVGDEVEKRLFVGGEEEEVEEEVVNEKGKKKVEKKKIQTYHGPVEASIYARMFDETLAGQGTWKPDANYNRLFLKAKQNYWNDHLRVFGYVFLNDIYKDLGYEPTSMGQIVGWLRDGDGDGFIDFGIFDQVGEYLPKSEFINGSNPNILLDFNVDGVIYDKI